MAYEPYFVTDAIKSLLCDVLPAVGVNGATNPDDNWSVHIGGIVAEPDRIIALNEAGGPPPEVGLLINYHAVQAIVRGATSDYRVTRVKAEEVKDRLLANCSDNIGPNGDRITSIVMQSEILFLGLDDTSQRPMFSLNFRVIWDPAPSPFTHRRAE